MRKDDQYFLKLAVKKAVQGACKKGGGPFGAIIVKDGEIIARAHNEVIKLNDPTAHAEVLAIRRACKKLATFQLKGCVIYSSCEPCPMCLGAIYWARPLRVVFASPKEHAHLAGFDDDLIYCEISKPHSERKIGFKLLELKNAKAPFEAWEKKDCKTKY